MDIASNIKTDLYLNVLPKATRKALDYFSEQGWLKNDEWYLAGGTALALQAGHRQSVDLDFFTTKENFSNSGLILNFNNDIWETDILREKTVYGKLHGAKVSFIAYPFFVPKSEFIYLNKLRILHKDDIAVMKIIAISQRGKKRDFIDLYWYCKHVQPLVSFFGNLSKQYPTTNHNYHHIVKSLTFFEDADNEPMPKLFFNADWKTIKKFFQKEAIVLARELLDLT